MADGQQVRQEDQWRVQLDKMRPEWQALFPSPQHLERFRRVVATAINGNPELLVADRRSLFGAATMAAQDGLMPDGRDGALIIYNVKVKFKDEDGQSREEWRKLVRWQAMVGGLLKKIRRSGELLDIAVPVVREKDHFKYQLGDDPKITHVPNIEVDDPGKLKFVYAIARTKDGGVYREVMTRKQVDEVRAANKNGAASFAWKDWYDEMARKSVLRRLSKLLPMGDEVEAIFAREEEEAASFIEAIPVEASLPRTNSRQAKLGGEWEKLTAEIDALAHMGECDDWRAKNEPRVRALPDAWQEQAWEYLDKRRDTIFAEQAE